MAERAMDLTAMVLKLMETKDQLKTMSGTILATVDDTLNTDEAAAIGIGLIGAGTAGLLFRHPAWMMYMASEAGDVAQELMSEIGDLTNIVSGLSD